MNDDRMNDSALSELKAIVEQAVRPVRATFNRKRRMREELLAHLTSIFGEESERSGGEQAALRQAKQRFGDPNELTCELQQAVPRWDRLRSLLEQMGYQSSESAWHLAAKHFLAILMINAIAALLVLGLQMPALRTRLNEEPVTVLCFLAIVLAGFVLVAALFNVVLSVVLATLLKKIGPVLASRHWGRILLIALSCLVALCGVLPYFTGAAVLFLLMARQTVKQWHYEADWA
jgi:hypothetical protein